MRLPPSVRYLPSRLQGVTNPWLWLGILLTGIVGVYAWEYRQNPAQLWQFSASSDSLDNSSSTDALLESLTPEEQAIAAELDNVELLLTQLDSDVSALTTGGEDSAAASLNAAAINGANEVSESSVERLNRYIEEYRFLPAETKPITIQSRESDTDSSSALSLQPTAQTEQPINVLAEALANQLSEQATATPGQPSQLQPTATADGADNVSGNAAGSGQDFVFDQTGVAVGRLEGLNRAFLRTTPNMSPPPGTTGYVPPATLPDFSQINQTATGANPFGTQQSSGGLNGGTSPAVNVPDRSQTLPPAESDVVTPLPIQTFDSASQAQQEGPRNAWEAFFD